MQRHGWCFVAVKHLFRGLGGGSYTELAVTGEFLTTEERKPQILAGLGGGVAINQTYKLSPPDTQQQNADQFSTYIFPAHFGLIFTSSLF